MVWHTSSVSVTTPCLSLGVNLLKNTDRKQTYKCQYSTTDTIVTDFRIRQLQNMPILKRRKPIKKLYIAANAGWVFQKVSAEIGQTGPLCRKNVQIQTAVTYVTNRFTCFKTDALSFKRQEIQRSFFLITQSCHERFFVLAKRS